MWALWAAADLMPASSLYLLKNKSNSLILNQKQMSLGSFLKTVGEDVTHIFSNSNEAYDKLLDVEKEAQTWVSGALAIINQNIKIDGALVAPIISSVFPNVDVATIENTLVQLAATVVSDQSKVPTTLAGAITVLQGFLSPKTGNVWITAVQGLVNLGATLVSPETAIQKFVAAGEYIYQDIIKPLLGIGSATPVATVNAPSVDVTTLSAPVVVAAPEPVVENTAYTPGGPAPETPATTPG